MSPTQASPTIDAVLKDVSLFKLLSREHQDEIYSAIAGAESFMRSHILVSRLGTQVAQAPVEDRAVPLKEAAVLLSMSRDHLYRNWHRLNGFKDSDGRIKFRLAYLRYRLKEKERGRQ